MPEFILDLGSPEHARAFDALDAFVQGYIEAMFFTEETPGTTRDENDERQWNPETDSALPGDCTFADLSPDALETIERDCNAFMRDNREALDEACDNGRSDGYDEQSAGRDFWFSRNGHGVGFWDRDLGEVGDTLHEAASAYGESSPCLGDDGSIYVYSSSCAPHNVAGAYCPIPRLSHDNGESVVYGA